MKVSRQFLEANQTLVSEVNSIVGSYPDNMYQIEAGQTTVTDLAGTCNSDK